MRAGLKNAFIERVAGIESRILPFPVQNSLTRVMRTAAAKQGNPGYQSMWAGQGVSAMVAPYPPVTS